LELELGDVRVRIPWGGQRPRDLTRVGLSLFLERERQKDERFFVDPDQAEFWPAGQKAPRIYRGAPLLLPMKEGS